MLKYLRNGIFFLGMRPSHYQRLSYNIKTFYEPVFAHRELFRSFCPQSTLQNEINALIAIESLSINVGKRFATMVILVDFADGEKELAGTWVLLTHRAAKMKKHANEISVPGGWYLFYCKEMGCNLTFCTLKIWVKY